MLSYFYDCVDEIIVLDGYSTDSTLEILSDFPDPLKKMRVFVMPQKARTKMRWSLPSNFHPEGWGRLSEAGRRNFLLSHAEGNWILRADPDECFEPSFKERLPLMVASEVYDVYLFPIYNFWGDPSTIRLDLYPHFQPRLFRNGLGIMFSQDPKHCYLQHKAVPLVYSDLRVKWTDIHVFHYHYVCGRSSTMPARGSRLLWRYRAKDRDILLKLQRLAVRYHWAARRGFHLFRRRLGI
jgi:glycosyltransferase involved in cell wall biosynthesis